MTMKLPAILTIILAAVAIGTFQRSKLHALEQRIAMVETPESAKSRTGDVPFPALAAHATQAEMEVLREDLVAVFLSRADRSAANIFDAATRRRMMLTASKFSAGEIGQLLQELRGDSRLAGMGEDQLLELFLEIFCSTAPAPTMGFLEGHRDLPRWADQNARAFNNFLISNPREAIRWYDAQVALGNPDVAGSSMRSSILIREARIDPDKMLARALSRDFASDSGALFRIGGAVASNLSQASEHREFLAALRRAQEKDSESPVLAKIRAEYVGGISSPLAGLPFEDASAIMDSEFTPVERLRFAASECHRTDLDGLEKWADWFLKIGHDDWKKREVTPGLPPDHPASAVLETWTESDYQAAGKWLEKVPPGPLRSEMVQKYSTRIAVIDPDMAATFIPEISDDKERRSLVNKIAKALESKDPKTAAAFRAAHPVSR
jgi:hypothetical protein